MSKDFIKERIGARHLEVAKRQQKQLSHFTQSEVQGEITQQYLTAWAQRKYATNDYFLNWVKIAFRDANFLRFFKLLRYPLPSAKLINDEIKPQLKRVYYADDSYFRYVIKGKAVENPEELHNKDFENRLFNSVLFNHNDIIIHDLDGVNSPYREIVCIDNVVSCESFNGKIKRLAYSASIVLNGVTEYGFSYVDAERYVFYKGENYEILIDEPHDLGICPASWISNEAFSTKNDIVRRSIFSYVRPELEEFTLLRTLLLMAEIAGAFPVTVKLKTDSKPKDGQDVSKLPNEPNTDNQMGSQQASRTNAGINSEDTVMQAGTLVETPLVKKQDGSIDMDVVQNFLKFYHFPVECLTYMNEKIEKVERSIIANALGDYQQNNDSAKNADQVKGSLDNKQDKLRSLSANLTWVRNQSDYMLLALKYGRDAVNVSLFYGSDFFLDNESELLDMIKLAPNTIIRKNLIDRLSKTKNRFNKERAERETLLNSLMPFTTDTEFGTALAQFLVTDVEKKLQLRFDYWVSMFEARYGDILIFYQNTDATSSERLIMINNLLTDLIKEFSPEIKVEPAKEEI